MQLEPAPVRSGKILINSPHLRRGNARGRLAYFDNKIARVSPLLALERDRTLAVTLPEASQFEAFGLVITNREARDLMAMFVHLSRESRIKSICRNGISRLRKLPNGARGIFAMPVTRNFYLSHQWLRELKRSPGGGPIVGVYFRIHDKEMVSIGHYNQSHQEMTAAQAAAAVMSNPSAEGFEVFIPRRIKSGEIHRWRELSQVLGWRYYPQSHGRTPCGCPFCQRGQYASKKLREEYEKS
jgi:hypothetical protein